MLILCWKLYNSIQFKNSDIDRSLNSILKVV